MWDSCSISSPGAAAAAVLEHTDPAGLADLDLVAYVQAAERQVAHATAVSWHATRLLAERASARVAKDLAADDAAADLSVGRREVMVERAGVEEVRQALHLSAVSTRNRLHRARAIAPDGPLALAGQALRTGLISTVHVMVLLDDTAGLSDHLSARLQAQCLPRASTQTPGNFGRSLQRALHHLDPTGTAAAHREARARAGVRTFPAEGGMGTLTVTATEPDTQWAYTVLDTLARAEQHRAHVSTSEGTDATDGTDGTGAENGTGDGVPRTPPTTNAANPGPAPEAGTDDGILTTPSQSAATSGATAAATTPHAEPNTRNGILGTPCDGTEPDRAEPNHDGVLRTPPTEPGGCEPLTLEQLRAKVFLDLLQRAVHDPTFPTTQGKRRIETQVVITLDTLLGLREDPATINGCSVPAPIAQEIAAGTTALRRLITDDVTGHLLDYGTTREPPTALTEFLLARDQHCRVPHCNIRASACDLDHAHPHHRHGPTSSANMGALCRGHHSPKTAGHTDLIKSQADGSAIYLTALGQQIVIPPRPVLELPIATDLEPEPEPEPDEQGPPPF